MPRPPRADEAGGLYHALNRGNLRATIFHKDEDYKAFERILYEGLQIHQVELFLVPTHAQSLPPCSSSVGRRRNEPVHGLGRRHTHDAISFALPH